VISVFLLTLGVVWIAYFCVDVIGTCIDLFNRVSHGAADAADEIDVSGGVDCCVEDDSRDQSLGHAGVFQSGTGEKVGSSGVSHGCCRESLGVQS
jgi:hypothetical protein